MNGGYQTINGQPQGAGGAVLGGSGVEYPTIAAAQVGETEDVVATFPAQAGTAPGVLVGAGLSGTDDFYNDYFVVNETPTPGDGLQCQYARVSDYDGATQTLTLDKPWNFAGESTMRLVRPIRLTLLEDVAESPTFVKNCVLSLAGHRIQGQVDQTAGSLLWIRGGSGYVTDGVQKTNIGVLWIEGCDVSRRGASIYAVLMTNGSDLGRTVLKDCIFSGVVAGRRGYAGWEVDGCRNYGIPEGSPTNRNIPYRHFESVAGVAVVVEQADVLVNGEWSGAVFYSENSLTGATANVTSQMDVKTPDQLSGTPTAEQPTLGYLYCSVGAATLTMTMVAGSSVIMRVDGTTSVATANPATAPSLDCPYGIALFVDFTGTFTVSTPTTNQSKWLFHAVNTSFAEIRITGSAIMSGAISLSQVRTFISGSNASYARMFLESPVSGSVMFGTNAQTFLSGLKTCIAILNTATQDQTPTVSIGGIIVGSSLDTFSCYDLLGSEVAGSVANGSWTISAPITVQTNVQFGYVRANGQFVRFASLEGATGGSFVISGTLTLWTNGEARIASAPGGFAGTLTISSAVTVTGGVTNNFGVLNDSPGGTVTMSGPITLRDMRLGGSGTLNNGGTMSNAVRFENVVALSNITLVANGSGPSSILFINCWTDRIIAESGTVTWTNAALRFENCFIDDLVTIVGDRFSTIEAFETFFNGNVLDKSITASGTRPATYRFWKCGFRARHDELFPEVVDDYTVIAAGGALTAGNLMTIDATPEVVNAGASSHVEGVLLIATGAVGDPAVLVRRGKMDVASRTAAPAVATGDNCILDPTTPTQQRSGITSPGQRISRALEAAGARVAGKAYSVVNLS